MLIVKIKGPQGLGRLRSFWLGVTGGSFGVGVGGSDEVKGGSWSVGAEIGYQMDLEEVMDQLEWK